MRFLTFCRKSNHGIGTFYCWNLWNNVSANILRKPHVWEKSGSKDMIFAVDPKWHKTALLNDPSKIFVFFCSISLKMVQFPQKRVKPKFETSNLRLPITVGSHVQDLSFFWSIDMVGYAWYCSLWISLVWIGHWIFLILQLLINKLGVQ